MRTFFNKFRNSKNTATAPSSSSNSAGQQPKNSRESSIDSCSEVAPEVTPMENMHPAVKLEEIIGEVIDINDRFITLETNQTCDEYKIAKKNLRFDLMMGGFYKCLGQCEDDGFFLPEQIKKLERPEVEERLAGSAPIAVNLNMASLLFPAANIFNPFGENGSMETGEDEQDWATALDTTLVGSCPSGSIEEEVSTPKAATIDTTTHFRPISPPTPTTTTGTNHLRGTVPAIVLSLGHSTILSSNGNPRPVLMFSPDCPHLSAFQFPRQSLEEPVKIGQWYNVQPPGIEGGGAEKESTMAAPFKQIDNAGWSPPLNSRIRDGIVQLYTEATLSQLKQDEGDVSGFVRCFSSKMPPIIDSDCLLSHLEETLMESRPLIRNALPPKQIGIWCALRRYPFGGFTWKVVDIEAKHRKRMKLAATEGGGMRGHHADKVDREKSSAASSAGGNGKENIGTIDDGISNNNSNNGRHRRNRRRKCRRPGGGEIGTKNFESNSSSRRTSTPSFNNQTDDGVICSCTPTDFIVYEPRGKRIAFLDKHRTNKDISMVGLWIQFKTSEQNGQQIVTDFIIIPHRIFSVARTEHVVMSCDIDVPRRLENSFAPYCRALAVNLTDPHNLLRDAHRGRTIQGEIGCRIWQQKHRSDGKVTDLFWEILHIKV